MIVLAILALLVSAAALAVSVKAESTARRSARSAARSQADALGTHVFVGDIEPLRERWNVSPVGLPDSFVGYPPGVAPPDRQFTRPGDNAVRLLVGAHVRVRNEGARTARLEARAFRVERCDELSHIDAVLAPPPERPAALLSDGVLVLAPGESAGLVVRLGPTVAEWERDGDQPYVATLTAAASPDGSSQHWRLVVTAPLLGSVWGNDAAFRVMPHTLPDAQLSELPRTYPSGVGGLLGPDEHRWFGRS